MGEVNESKVFWSFWMKITAGIIATATVVTIFYNLAVWADDRWNEEPLLEEYAQKEDLSIIQQQVDLRFLEMQRREYLDAIEEIRDLQIDGIANNSHLKKKHRFEDRLEDINKEILRLKQ